MKNLPREALRPRSGDSCAFLLAFALFSTKFSAVFSYVTTVTSPLEWHTMHADTPYTARCAHMQSQHTLTHSFCTRRHALDALPKRHGAAHVCAARLTPRCERGHTAHIAIRL